MAGWPAGWLCFADAGRKDGSPHSAAADDPAKDEEGKLRNAPRDGSVEMPDKRQSRFHAAVGRARLAAPAAAAGSTRACEKTAFPRNCVRTAARGRRRPHARSCRSCSRRSCGPLRAFRPALPDVNCVRRGQPMRRNRRSAPVAVGWRGGRTPWTSSMVINSLSNFSAAHAQA